MAIDLSRFEEEQALIREWIDIILRRWKVVIPLFVVFTLSIFIALYYIYEKNEKLKDYYTAMATVLITPERYEVKTAGGEIIKETRPYYSQASILKSEMTATRAADILIQELGYKESKGKLLAYISKILSVEPVTVKDRSGPFVDELIVSATSVDPRMAFDIVNAVIEGYIRQKKDDVEQFFVETYKTLSQQLDIARRNLHRTESSLVDFTLKNEDILKAIKTYGSKEKERGVLSDDLGINEQYIKLKSDITATQDFINSVKETAKADRIVALTMIEKVQSNLVDLNLKKLLLEKQEELNRLLIVNEQAHPEVIRAQAEVKSIEYKIDAEIANSVKSMELDLEALRLQEKELAALVQPEVQKKIIAYGILKRDLEVKQKIYHKLAEDLQQLNIGEKLKRYSETKVLETAKLPNNPSAYAKQELMKVITISIVVGLFISIGIISIPEMLDMSIKNVGQLEQIIELPVLATIPKHKKMQKPKD